jgi:hypothetical protein
MFNIKIYRNSVVTNEATFSTEEELHSWLSNHESQGNFGQKAQSIEQQVEVAPAVIDEEGNEVVPALFETQVVEVPGYTVEITDLTAQLEQEKANAEAEAFLAGSDWKVIRHRDQQELGIATSLTGEEFQSLLQERQMARASIVK